MITRRTLFIAPLFLLAACKKSEPGKRYTMHGVIMALDPQAQVATIQHDKIDNWMEAMTMEYPVKPAGEFQKLKVGQKITATVVVNDLKFYVTDVKVE